MKEKLSLATAESCTGGLLAKTLTDNAGSSEYFMGSVVAYSNEAKVNMLNVSQEALDTHGAVSHEVARELARGAQQKFRTDVALSTTGIAGPGGGTDEKPVGTVFIGLAFKDELYSFKRVFPFSRTAMRSFTNAAALDFLRRKVEELPLRESIE